MASVQQRTEEFETMFSRYVANLNCIQEMLEAEDRIQLETEKESEDLSADFCKGLVRALFVSASCRTPGGQEVRGDIRGCQEVALRIPPVSPV